MANPLYGQNKADARLNDSVRMIVGDTFSIAATDTVAADLYGHVQIPAGSFVHKVVLETMVAATGGTAATTAYDVGSVDNPDLFLDDVDGAADSTGLGTLGQFVGAGGSGALGVHGWYFAAADTIAATCVAESSTVGSARILVWLSNPS